MSLMVKFGLDSSKFESGLNRMKASTKAFADDTEKSMTSGKLGFLRAAGSAGVLAGGIAAVGFAMTKGSRSAAAWGSTIGDQALEAQISVEKLQTLLGVGLDAGRGADVILTALRGFNSRVAQAGDGAETYRKEIEKLGHTTEDFIKLPVDKRLEALAVHYAQAEDKTSAYLTAVKLLGEDAAPKLLEVLQRIGTDGFDVLHGKMRASGHIIANDVVDALDSAEDAAQRLEHSIKMVGVRAVGNLALLAGFGKKEGDTLAAWQRQFEGLRMILDPVHAGSVIGESLSSNHQANQAELATKDALVKSGRAEIINGKFTVIETDAQKKVSADARAKKGADELKSFALSTPDKFKKMFSAFGVFGDGFDKEKTSKSFTPVASTSLGAIGGGAVGGLSMQVKQIDILTKIEKNTRSVSAGASKSL